MKVYLDEHEIEFLDDLLSIAIRHWSGDASMGNQITRCGLREAMRRAEIIRQKLGRERAQLPAPAPAITLKVR